MCGFQMWGPCHGWWFQVTRALGESQGVLLDGGGCGLHTAVAHVRAYFTRGPFAASAVRWGALCLNLQLFRGLAQLTRC